YVEDFDQDGIYDLIGGFNQDNGYAGANYLFYGTTDWGSSKSKIDADWVVKGANQYDYLGYHYGNSLGSGDFNIDGYPDILMGAYGYRPNNNYYAGCAFMFLSAPSETHVTGFELLDGDGENYDILTPEAGGNRYEPADGQIGDGVYTLKVSYNDTWTVVEAQEIMIEFKLKSEFMGLSYVFGYSMINDTFFVYEGIGGGIIVYDDRSEFIMNGYHNAEVYIAFSITMDFITPAPFDVTATVKTARSSNEITYKDWLHVEMDLTFDNEDVTVMRDEDVITRGDSLSGGSSLVASGLRVVYEGTSVSPLNDKFYLRVMDNYGRIFENHTSAGKDIFFEIPTNVDSGKFIFNVHLIVDPLFTDKLEDISNIPGFYVNLDFDGPEAPPNLKFHADMETDPEGRWDNDAQVWATWDPAFDSQVGIQYYKYQIEGPEGFFDLNQTEEFLIELELAGDGVYTLYVWAVDRVGNDGSRAVTTLVKDTGEIVFRNSMPNFLGEVWHNSVDVDVIVEVVDIVRHPDGPHLHLPGLEYAVTTSMSEGARDGATWKDARYLVLNEVIDDIYKTYTLSVKVPNLLEGKNNYAWFRVSDEAGNVGYTSYLPSDDENATIYNPGRIWVDTEALEYSDPSPSSDALDENIVTSSVKIDDELSGVDASSIQYSISRDGLTHYGGWISAELKVDGNHIDAETISPILFQPGSTNYIRWRAKDVSGNGYTLSRDFVINIVSLVVNNPPKAEITYPEMDSVFKTNETIIFNAGGSSDVDLLDELSYRWVLGNKDQISIDEVFPYTARDLGRGVHVVTLYVTDGQFTVTDSVSIYVQVHPDELDTDGDGILDGEDDDDDNDGLKDLDEEILGTNPRLKDSDRDGYDDSIDVEPLNKLVWADDKNEGMYSYWNILVLFVIIGFILVLISAMLVFRRRSTMEKEKVLRTIAKEGRIVERYETLTGIGAPLLPQVKEMGVSLPPIAAQQVAPLRRAKDLSGTLNLPPTSESVKEEPQEAPAPSEPVSVPEPAPAPVPAPVVKKDAPVRRVRRKSVRSAPGSIPTPEKLMETAALPGSGEESASELTSTTCDLCGSTIDVPSGASSVECPLCGEKKTL
ncbi:MAG: hypothetical protein U9R75_11905, partial [Candidatus Thermoplasmatota archaeon]|nr:hypothetical protein [Candidatus Thermoplasmatota archaeon]